jgi:hypothetical protein
MTKAAELAKMGEVLTNSQIGGRRNIIINGAMQVAQRGTSFNYTTTDAYSLDRFRIDVTGGDNSAGAFTLTQADVTDLPGFTKAMKFDVTTADTSIAAGEALNLSYRIEGQDLQQLKKGTSEAEKFIISFYVKGTAKTYALEILDIDNNRMNHQTFGVTTSWNRVVLTFDGDTTGALDNNNERSLDLNFWFHAGSTYAGGTMATGWGTSSGTNANRAAGIGSLYSSTDNELFITGLQMEVGSQATPFEHRSFGEELGLCQRYYYERMGLGTALAVSGGEYQWAMNGIAYNTTLGLGGLSFPTPMRATPALGYSAVAHFVKQTAGRGDEVTAINLYDGAENATISTAYIQFNSSTSTAGGAIMTTQNASARLNFDAEL